VAVARCARLTAATTAGSLASALAFRPPGLAACLWRRSCAPSCVIGSPRSPRRVWSWLRRLRSSPLPSRRGFASRSRPPASRGLLAVLGGKTHHVHAMCVSLRVFEGIGLVLRIAIAPAVVPAQCAVPCGAENILMDACVRIPCLVYRALGQKGKVCNRVIAWVMEREIAIITSRARCLPSQGYGRRACGVVTIACRAWGFKL